MLFPYSARPHARSHLIFIAASIALALALAASAKARAAMPSLTAPVTLTLALAQQHAVARSRQLTAQDHAAGAARDMAIAAGQLPDPVLSAGIDNLPVSSSDRFSVDKDFMTMRRIGVSQELTRADKRQWRAARFEGEAQKAAAQKEVIRGTILRATALAWVACYYTEKMAGLIAAQADQARQEIDAAQAAYRGGRGVQADVLAARAVLLLLDDRASDLHSRLDVSRANLARWTGLAGTPALVGEPDIDQVRLDIVTLDSVLAHHPSITVLNRQEEIGRAEAGLARANQRADWSVEVAFQQRGAAFSNMLSVGMSIPLQWDRQQRQDRELGAKLSQVAQSAAERDETLREHVGEIRAMVLQWHSGRARIARFKDQLIPLAGDQRHAVLASYRGGKATLTDVLAARRNETEVRMQAVELQLTTAQLWAQLNFLLPDGGSAQHATTTSSKAPQ